MALVALLATVCYAYAYKRYDEEDWDIWSISSLGLGVFFTVVMLGMLITAMASQIEQTVQTDTASTTEERHSY